MDELHRNVGKLGAGLTPRQADDARARVAEAMSLRARAVDVLRFAARPTYVGRSMAWQPGSGSALALMIGLNVLVVGLSSALIHLALGPSGVLPELAKDTQLSPREVLNYVFLAPLLEEPLHRGWLNGRKAALRFAAFGCAALVLFLVGFLIGTDGGRILALFGVATAFIGLIQWGLTRHRECAVPEAFIRHFRWLVWGSSLVFGLVHLGNYKLLTNPIGVLVVLPLMLAGLLLAYTRTRLGLRAAILHHAGYNMALVAAVLAVT